MVSTPCQSCPLTQAHVDLIRRALELEQTFPLAQSRPATHIGSSRQPSSTSMAASGATTSTPSVGSGSTSMSGNPATWRRM
jgi:hypothetical protein